MNAWIAVALGSAVGGVLRYGLSRWVDQVGAGSRFPWGTWVVNILGSLLIGYLAGRLPDGGRLPPSEGRDVFLMVGVCGGFTTFSAFSLQSVQLVSAGQMRLAFLYAAASLVGCVCCTGLGYWLARPSV
jgi:CrcB protein